MKISAWFQYLYFFRFSIMFWCFLPILTLLDYLGNTTTITRAFVAPNSAWQGFHIAFFTVSLHMIVLVTARNICMNGKERFYSTPPASLSWLFCSPAQFPVWLSLGLAHIPSVSTLIYVAWTARREGETRFHLFDSQSGGSIWLSLIIGSVAALFFWYAVSLFYYWTYTEPELKSGMKTQAKPLIFPQRFFGDLEKAPRPIVASVLEYPLRLLTRITFPGFAHEPDGPLWELHFLSFVSLLAFLLLYIFLYPLTSPVPRSDDLHLGVFVAWFIAVLFITGIAFPLKRGQSKWVLPVKGLFFALSVGLAAIFCLSAHQFESQVGVEWSLPVLASILVICSFALWALAGLGFLLDRYRIPVFTTFLLMICLPKIFHWTYGEHYFLAADRAETNVLPLSPAQTLALRTRDSNDPLIVITSTGGGIHAAAWTTEILGRLEKEFSDDPELHSAFGDKKHYYFHDHVLLASSVSGGSVGLMPYLLGYTAGTPTFDRARMTNAAACSSIEDVAWGLEYYDLIRLLSNFWISRRSDIPPPDRNWALTEAFNRNLNSPVCQSPGDEPSQSATPREDGKSLTLGKAAQLLQAGGMPAFTLNTTAVETGGRFLLSNYQIPKNFAAGKDLLPAESFLHAYGEPCDKEDHEAFADLPVATAARLSATFPYVSAASRIPKKFAKFGYHFVDGGYYDNDGTASAIEFLQSALSGEDSNSPKDPCVGPYPAASKTAQGDTKQSSPGQRAAQRDETTRAPYAILLIEIRNSDDLDPTTNVDDYNFQTHPEDQHLWSALSQLSAPAGALWKAGHESVTRRNRLGLCLLETTYSKELTIHHIVFNFDPATPSPQERKKTNERDLIQPLNWHLTTAELGQIRDKADEQKTNLAIADARDWIKGKLKGETVAPNEASKTKDKPCQIAFVRDPPIEAAQSENKPQ